ncbi:MAG TPA: hypothetical protein VGD70_07475 [Actinophytocola sp.]
MLSFSTPVRSVSGGRNSIACSGSLARAWRSVMPKSATAGVPEARNNTLCGDMPP